MKTTILVAVLAFALTGNALGASYSKRTLSDARLGTSKPELLAQISYSTRMDTFFRDKHRWMLAARHGTCWSHVPWAKTCNTARLTLRKHDRLLARAQAKYDQLYAVGHVDGWTCITEGAYAGAPHEGNGYNGSYTGWLGMTTPWAGHYPPGSDWVHSNQMDVYRIAESEAAKHGWADSWMRQQWPRTYPPCASHF